MISNETISNETISNETISKEIITISHRTLDLNKVERLPEDVLHIIKSFIPIKIGMFLTKINYIEHHCLFKNYIDKRNIENYIRDMVRQDNDFVFTQILNENYKRWLAMKKYMYKSCIYANYIIFVDSYCIENKATNCRFLINKKLEELGLSKNQHKKNAIKYIRWKH
jgi:hypothetical protein